MPFTHRTAVSRLAVALMAACLGITAAAAHGRRVADGLKPTQLDITNDTTHRYGEPEIAVNPTNPNNLVYYVMSNMLTYKCEASGNSNCTKFSNGAPNGEFATAGWISTHVFVSFDRGRSWRAVNFPSIPAYRGFTGESTDHSDLISRGDPMVTVTAGGTFYIGWDAMHLGFQNIPGYGVIGSLIDGGIAVSKSTDGGRTWSVPVLTGTGVDRPWMTTDLSTGAVYEASSGFVNGSMSTGNPALPIFSSPPDRYVVSSRDGVSWTAPEPLGGGGFSGSKGSFMAAAYGRLAATFRATTNAACEFFVSAAAPCVVFETSTDSGMDWTRHPVPGLATSTGTILVAANPVRRGTFTVSALDAGGTRNLVVVTHDYGSSWTGPSVVTDDPGTTKFKTWINYAPDGVLALMWRSVLPTSSATGSPTSSATLQPDTDTAQALLIRRHCGYLGCGLERDANDDPAPPGSYQVWAAVSNDSGKSFSLPLRISSAPSPPPDPNMLGGTDDTSVVALSNQDVFVGWGDWRPGDVAGFFSAVKLQAFHYPGDHRR